MKQKRRQKKELKVIKMLVATDYREKKWLFRKKENG